jgi:hypothetical protein
VLISPARRAALGTALGLVAAALLLANGVKRGIVSEDFFEAHEKTVE